MAIHNILGKAGEDAAAKYLEQNGYTIRDRNWRKIGRASCRERVCKQV